MADISIERGEFLRPSLLTSIVPYYNVVANRYYMIMFLSSSTYLSPDYHEDHMLFLKLMLVKKFRKHFTTWANRTMQACYPTAKLNDELMWNKTIVFNVNKPYYVCKNINESETVCKPLKGIKLLPKKERV